MLFRRNLPPFKPYAKSSNPTHSTNCLGEECYPSLGSILGFSLVRQQVLADQQVFA